MSISSEVLVESRTMRSQYTDRFEVLDKAGSLSLLPDDTHATTEMVADFYEVPVDTVSRAVRRNREELENNGYRVLRGESLKSFKDLSEFKTEGQAVRLSQTDLEAEGLFKGVRSLALFNRKAILNVGMLLTESDVARKVRAYLLSAEEMLTDEQRRQAWLRSRLNGIEARNSFTETLKIIYEMSETSKSFGIWASTFTTMMTKATLKIDHKEFQELKAKGGGNARNAMTEDQLKRMDMAENLVRSYAHLKGANSIKDLYHEAKDLMP
jgi:hypothetical protein